MLHALLPCPAPPMPQDGDAHGEHAHWNYEHHGLDWTGTCQSGKAQSPIAIPLTSE